MRTYRIAFSRKADARLDQIHGFILKAAGPEIAARYVHDLVKACYDLAVAPHRGDTYEHLYPGMHVIGFGDAANIQFVVRGEEVRILDFSYQGQNYQGRLKRKF